MLIFFCENRHYASFYIKEQSQKNKFKIWVLKTTILDPRKSAFWVFKEKNPKKCFLRVSAMKIKTLPRVRRHVENLDLDF